MKLVLLFFCVILVFMVLSITLLLLSSIKLNVEKIYIGNIKKYIRQKHIEKEVLIYLELYLFGKVKIMKIKIDKKLINKFRLQNKVKDVKKDIETIEKAKAIGIIKKLKLKLDEFNLEAEFGTEDVVLTAFLVAIVSSFIRNRIRQGKTRKSLLFYNATV